jgi:hypothetical protein
MTTSDLKLKLFQQIDSLDKDRLEELYEIFLKYINGKKKIEEKNIFSKEQKQRITKEHFIEIADKYGEFASWAVWENEELKPKSNIGDMRIFDLEKNPNLLETLNPNVIMVGLNFSRTIERKAFVNFHDKRPQGQDYKIRYAFRDTEFYGAYMTDIIKDFEEKISGNVLLYLKENKEFELNNVRLFEQEITDLKCKDPLIIAFGNITYDILNKHFGMKYRIKKVMHYSQQISKENYKAAIWRALLNKEPE